jgi:hypothetical protein
MSVGLQRLNIGRSGPTNYSAAIATEQGERSTERIAQILGESGLRGENKGTAKLLDEQA